MRRLIKGLLLLILLITGVSIGYMRIHNQNFNEFALSIFTTIKNISGNDVNLDQIQLQSTIPVAHGSWTELLQKHVSEAGMVDYKGFLNDSSLLKNYLHKLSNHPPGNNWSDDEKLAYWINAYNSFTIKLIIDHYPLLSIKDISGGLPMINSPWDLKFFEIGGVPMDLNTIEHEILRKQFDEPRIHFAINCASISCPVLRDEAYTPESLYMQLHEQAIVFLTDESRNYITESETRISKIFNWFQRDFTRNGTLINYIGKYHSEIDPMNKIEYISYDWRLNDI